MAVSNFIRHKTVQLVYYVRGFWRGLIPYSEINLFVWDTFEEWRQVTNRHSSPLSEREQVFWHLIYQVHALPPDSLLQDNTLRTELAQCIEFLEHGGFKPFECVGIRP
ncbi:hypothetical protein J3L16_13190 [Alteromonas sp. 5E99-2]|uniref:hypothetical protein n=1 Tax=Alteromonas sp. 5E99-2 TaxID=2817683 RepID=UPI001A99AF10|nr:hypothetical protein [Alteromonas sp. 5E99-2]MBO1256642.1 hypothetical protein [Alteromonas sp. 5E99-2]